MTETRTRRAAATFLLLAVAGCGTDPAGDDIEPAPLRAEVVQRISYEEDPPSGTEATLGGVGALTVCLLDVDGEPTDDCISVGVLDEGEWSRYQVGDEYPVAGTGLEESNG